MPLGPFDSWLLLSFGGPEGPDDVTPFLRNVTAGRGVPDARLAEVAAQYEMFGGRSPINGHNRALRSAVEAELTQRGHSLTSAWGNRNWTPTVPTALEELRDAGCTHTVCIATSAFSSYSGCRQYHDDIERARAGVPGAPAVQRVRVFWNHPAFVGSVADRIVDHLEEAGLDGRVATVFTAHSIPVAQAATCDYAQQLREATTLVARSAGLTGRVELAYQSRSGPPSVPWLEPDINDTLRTLSDDGVEVVLVVPLGFLSDHMEVVFDLDTQAAATAEALGIQMIRVATVGSLPRFVSMLVDLMEEAAGLRTERPSVGRSGPRPDICAAGCCPAPQRPDTRSG